MKTKSSSLLLVV